MEKCINKTYNINKILNKKPEDLKAIEKCVLSDYLGIWGVEESSENISEIVIEDGDVMLFLKRGVSIIDELKNSIKIRYENDINKDEIKGGRLTPLFRNKNYFLEVEVDVSIGKLNTEEKDFLEGVLAKFLYIKSVRFINEISNIYINDDRSIQLYINKDENLQDFFENINVYELFENYDNLLFKTYENEFKLKEINNDLSKLELGRLKQTISKPTTIYDIIFGGK